MSRHVIIVSKVKKPLSYLNESLTFVLHQNKGYDIIKHKAQCWPPAVIASHQVRNINGPLARYVKLRVAHAPGIPGTFSPPPQVNNPDMHHVTCPTYVPWCMPGSLTSGFLKSSWQRKRSRYSMRMRNSQFYISGKSPMDCRCCACWHSCWLLCTLSCDMGKAWLQRMYNDNIKTCGDDRGS